MSDKPSESSPLEREVSRRGLLAKAGKLGAGALVAGAVAAPAEAARSKAARTSAKVPTGGTVTWALEQDPAFIAPFGATLTANRWGNEMMYESLLEWDPKLNLKPAIAESYKVSGKKSIDFQIRKGIKFSDGSPVTANDVIYSFLQQATPPAPGTSASTSQLPAIDHLEAITPTSVRMHLKQPDARVYGYLAWQRYSSIVPNGIYSSKNMATDGIGTGPFMLNGKYVSNDHVNFVKNPNYWKPGLPYLDAINFPIITDEQTRLAALRTGQIDGATVSVDGAAAINGAPNVTVLHGLTAAFRELQFTIKPGENKPWSKKQVRQAINFAINRANILKQVYNGYGQYSGVVAAGYGPWPLTDDQLQSKYEKYDLPTAKSLMKAAGVSGFDVTMTTFATPTDFAAIAALIKADLSQIGINVNIVPQDSATFGANNSAGSFDWDLTARGMRGDVDGYVAEYHPAAAIYGKWFSGWGGNKQMFKDIGNGRITLDPAKRLPIYHDLNKVLMDECLEIGLVSVSKWQVVNRRVKNMYVAFTDFNTGLRNAYIKA